MSALPQFQYNETFVQPDINVTPYLWLKFYNDLADHSPAPLSPFASVNGCSFTSQSILFTSQSAQYLSRAGIMQNIGSKPFGLSCWININSMTDTNEIFYLGEYQVGGFYCEVGTAGNINWYVNQSGGDTPVGTANGLITTGQWYNLVFSRVGGNGAIYLNGVLAGSSSLSNPTDSVTSTYVGAYFQSGTGTFTHYFSGNISDLRTYYNNSLTQAQAQTLYKNGRK